MNNKCLLCNIELIEGDISAHCDECSRGEKLISDDSLNHLSINDLEDAPMIINLIGESHGEIMNRIIGLVEGRLSDDDISDSERCFLEGLLQELILI